MAAGTRKLPYDSICFQPLTFFAAALLTYLMSFRFDLRFLVPLAAGNFLYIGASDLAPELNKAHTVIANLLHFGAFAAGMALLFMLQGM